MNVKRVGVIGAIEDEQISKAGGSVINQRNLPLHEVCAEVAILRRPLL
jgi:hypothetical protein